jgi:hypothetical protein
VAYIGEVVDDEEQHRKAHQSQRSLTVDPKGRHRPNRCNAALFLAQRRIQACVGVTTTQA